MTLVGKTRQQIADQLRDRGHEDLVDVIFSMAAVQELFTAPEIAKRSRINVRDVRKDMKAGKFVDPIFGAGFFVRGGNSKKVTAGAVQYWRRTFFVPVAAVTGKNGHGK
jgi:hypothetical protein